MLPLVSVIVPSYNRPQFLGPLIDSFHRQSWKEIELIIVDDGGAVQFPDFAKPFVICKQNGGTPDALNFGILAAKGKYICTLGDDDTFADSDSVAARVRFAEGKGLEVVYTNANQMNERGDITKTGVYAETTLDALWRRDTMNFHSMLWRKDIHDRVGYFSTDLLFDEDWEWKLRLMNECKCGYLEQITAVTRFHSSNKTYGVNRPKVEADQAKMLARLKEKYNA